MCFLPRIMHWSPDAEEELNVDVDMGIASEAKRIIQSIRVLSLRMWKWETRVMEPVLAYRGLVFKAISAELVYVVFVAEWVHRAERSRVRKIL